MRTAKEFLNVALNAIRCIPHVIIFMSLKNKSRIKADIESSLKNLNKDYKTYFGLLYLLSFSRGFRSLFYYRTRPYSFFLPFICPGQSNLYIQTKQIGEGMKIMHGFATAIGAESIGNNCTIYQQVTIGGTDAGAPTIKDNVTIYAGAVIFGKITIGNDVTIGANATVYTNVPDNSSVLPGTSKVFRWKKR
ncbi:serine O-acetyltransferase [Saccharicrinis carchari]|uniref:Serine O-acetyltransferase n=1 Tax=Saccharicrinis carchari TaxID=1168039 RepID=A0A521BW37_SACCC|nr:serine acetyltransferase [Saccharicrinis carchari]SMO50650.1 serine O-acetyltransferase [Saccharicrinis carchari]